MQQLRRDRPKDGRIKRLSSTVRLLRSNARTVLTMRMRCGSKLIYNCCYAVTVHETAHIHHTVHEDGTTNSYGKHTVKVEEI